MKLMNTVATRDLAQTSHSETAYRVGGQTVTVKQSGAETGGLYTLFTQEVPPGGGTPPHRQHHEDETLQVLSGTFAVHVDGHTEIVTPGMSTHLPRGAVRWIRNVGGTDGRLQTIATPAGIEKMFAEMDKASRRPEPSTTDQALRIAASYGMEIFL
jgi:quercetin dioxygenase-like cupin family protein